MKWSNEQKELLKKLCYAGTPNADLAKIFGVSRGEIHAKRSALGVTIPKCRAGKPGARTTEEILKEVQEAQTVKNRAADLIADCDKRMEELKQEMDQDPVSDGLRIVLDEVAYEFSDAEKAHNALAEAADEDYLACTRDGVYWMGDGDHA